MKCDGGDGRKTADGCVPGRSSLCDVRAPGQGGVGLLYIAISLLFLLMTVIAEMEGGVEEEEEEEGVVREAGRCSVRLVQPDS